MWRRLVCPGAGLVVFLVAACGGTPKPDDDYVPRTETMLRVENQDFLDMNVYAIRSGQRIRLGSVPGLSTRVLSIPASLVGGGASLRFLADPVGSGRTPVSHEIFVQPGDVIEITIRAQLRE